MQNKDIETENQHLRQLLAERDEMLSRIKSYLCCEIIDEDTRDNLFRIIGEVHPELRKRELDGRIDQ